jgi:signal transduction histidine kinase
MGVLCVDNPAGGGAFAPEDLVTLSALANPAAMAIENARLHQAVEAATEAKAAFVSVVSHELRVPMTSIKGYADMLRQGVAGPLNDLQGSFVDTIRRNVDRMGALVSDLSEMNSIESGRLVLRTEPLDLAGSVSEAIAVLQAQFDEKQQRVAVELAADLEPVHGDRSRVVEILTRLLSNASKYSPAGRPIVVRAARIQDGARAWMRLQVVDHGYGISREDQSRLFSPFFRSDDPDVRHETGWGLGLSIAKMLVEAQSGRVTVESEPKLGSNFGFTLPVAME